MSIIPIPLRRRLRQTGFTEEQTEVLDEISDAVADAARDGLVPREESQDQFHALREDIASLKNDNALLRGELQNVKWWLFGALSLLIVGAMAVILAAIAVWG